MSTESFVNRVAQSAPSGYSPEQIQEIEASPVKPSGAPTELVDPGMDLIQQKTEVESAASRDVALAELLEQLKKEHAESHPAQQGMNLGIDSVDLIEFQEFKRQVIAAFKHLGFDTRKHFTE